MAQAEVTSQQIKRLIHNFLDYKYLFAACIAIALVFAYLFNKYTPRAYSNSTTLLIKTENKGSLLKNDDLAPLVGLMGGTSNIDNEIGMLTSFSLIEETISHLDFEVSYYNEKKTFLQKYMEDPPFTITWELYNTSPIKVEIDPSKPQPIYLRFDVEILNEEEFILTASGERTTLYNYIDNEFAGSADSIRFRRKFKFGEFIEADYMSFKVTLTDNYPYAYAKDANLYFQLNNMEYVTLQYRGSLATETTSPASTLLKVTATGANYSKITDFLNELINVFLNRNLKRKNNMAKSTVDFIDSQISDVADSLGTARTTLENFRSANQVMDLSFQGQRIFDQLNTLETEKAGLMSQRRYYEYLQGYFNENRQLSDLVAPSSMNVVDPLLTNLVTQLITLSTERQNLISNARSGEQNLYLNNLETQINNLKRTISENVNNNLNTLKISINEIDYRINRLSGEISKLPKTELQLTSIQRKFNLNEEIYTFLLERRAEAQIARASNSPDYEVIDSARFIKDSPIKPKKKLNFMIALVLGTFIPAAFVIVKDLLDNKINDKRDIEHLTSLPMIGHLFHNSRKTNTIIADHPKSAVAESFRSVRTNLQILSQGKTKQLFVVTSSQSGEGKSFAAINLASAFALFGRKTLLLGFDLRRPMLFQDFNLTNILGISSYLSNRALLDDIIQPTPLANLDLIAAGPVPPNPVELIASDRTNEMITRLRKMYDYIIIDTAPVGVVTDTFLLMNYADVNIFVCRQAVTTKDTFTTTVDSIENNKITNLNILLNDVHPKKAGYGYGYDTKYYGERYEKQSLWKRIARRRSRKKPYGA